MAPSAVDLAALPRCGPPSCCTSTCSVPPLLFKCGGQYCACGRTQRCNPCPGLLSQLIQPLVNPHQLICRQMFHCREPCQQGSPVVQSTTLVFFTFPTAVLAAHCRVLFFCGNTPRPRHACRPCGRPLRRALPRLVYLHPSRQHTHPAVFAPRRATNQPHLHRTPPHETKRHTCATPRLPLATAQ